MKGDRKTSFETKDEKTKKERRKKSNLVRGKRRVIDISMSCLATNLRVIFWERVEEREVIFDYDRAQRVSDIW